MPPTGHCTRTASDPADAANDTTPKMNLSTIRNWRILRFTEVRDRLERGGLTYNYGKARMKSRVGGDGTSSLSNGLK